MAAYKPQRWEVDPNTGCWNWLLSKKQGGYGRCWHRDADGRGSYQLAHRVNYERFRGPIPDGLVLDHLCRNPACVNPDHLEAVTQAENSRRGSMTKLTAAQVVAIRSDPRPYGEIASAFGIHPTTVSQIRIGKRWSDSNESKFETPVAGEPFVIPMGTPVHSMGTGRWHTSRRQQTVFPFGVAKYDEQWIVTWPGSHGYWRRVVIDGEAFVDRWPFEGPPKWKTIDARNSCLYDEV